MIEAERQTSEQYHGAARLSPLVGFVPLSDAGFD
jgi:hypothetical protein